MKRFPTENEPLGPICSTLKLRIDQALEPDYEIQTKLGHPNYTHEQIIVKNMQGMKNIAEEMKDIYEGVSGSFCSKRVAELTQKMNQSIAEINKAKETLETPTFHTRVGKLVGPYAPRLVQTVGKMCGYEYPASKSVSSP